MTETIVAELKQVSHASTSSADTAPLPGERAGASGLRGSRLAAALTWLRSRPGVAVSALWIAVLLLAALVPTLFTATDPLAVSSAIRQPPSAAHLFGTDAIGRDLFSRVVHGAGLSLGAAAIAVLVGVLAGTLIGLLAGYRGGWVDAVLMRFADVLLAIPGLLLSLAFVVALGFGTVNVAIAVGVTSIASNARVLRSEVLKVRNSVFVEAAVAGGARPVRVLLRHVLPNSIAPLLALVALDFSAAILAISALSFLGYGAQPPTPEWGALVAGGRDFLATAWWMTTLPGLVIALTVLAGNRLSRAFTAEGAR
ncbi:ABC transporter permease [Leifsonia shinshuensis]|uniref:Peptide/nickel transport system permease protein n=1 Tax=Leifsonia shinshuensis TaxID=150026 RepID=A0A853CUM4_9MICO|nr:ABC transporter permease [Leifsonia shinshuensis]NYJ22285.1 peptide/nickel transport system permease protein [Leifsonia shinshuensis]